jgi:hypothetical protein
MAKRNQRRNSLGDRDTPEIVPTRSIRWKTPNTDLPLFQPAALAQPRQIGTRAHLCSYDVGHMLGSTAMVLTLKENGRERTLAFSGDVGRCNLPITKDPEPLPSVRLPDRRIDLRQPPAQAAGRSATSWRTPSTALCSAADV